MSKIQELAERTAAEIPADPKNMKAGIDPIVLVDIVADVVKLMIYVYDCWKAVHPGSLQKIHEPAVGHIFKLRRLTRKVIAKRNASANVSETVNAILKMGKTVTMDDLTAVLSETANDKTIQTMATEYGEP